MDFRNATTTDIFNEILAWRDANFPSYTSRDKTDFGVMLMWIFAIIFKFYADWVYRLFNNMFISSATDREYIVDGAIERGYRPRGVISSIQLLAFTVNQAMTIPAGTQVQTDDGIIFETMEDVSSSGAGTVYVYAQQGVTYEDEFTGDGTEDQRYTTNQNPIVEGSITVTVSVESVDTEFEEAESILLGEEDEYVFASYADHEGYGIIQFGAGVNGHIPASGSIITIAYRVGDGESGNVEDGAITSLVSSLAGVTGVTNINVSNTEVTAIFETSETSIEVEDTSSFPSSGTAYVGGYSFTYTSKTSTSFDGVSGLYFPLAVGAEISANIDGLVQGKALETDDEIRNAAIMIGRTNYRIVSGEDFSAFVASHPGIAWAKYFVQGNIVRVVAVPVDGESMSETLRTTLISMVNSKCCPSVRFFIEDPTRITIDVAIEIEAKAGTIFESTEIVSDDPLYYKGVSNNVVKVIEDMLSPLNAESIFGTATTIRSYDIYRALAGLPNNQVKNSRVVSMSKSVPEDDLINVSGTTITLQTGTWSSSLDVGDVIKILGSVSGNNQFVKVVSVDSTTEITVNYSFSTETGIMFYYANTVDVVLGGKAIPTVGTILVIDKTKDAWYIVSTETIAHPSVGLNGAMAR